MLGNKYVCCKKKKTKKNKKTAATKEATSLIEI